MLLSDSCRVWSEGQFKEGQGSALDPLGPSRLGVLRTTAPDPNFIGSEIGIGRATADQIHALHKQYRRLQPRSANAGGGTPSGVQGAEPPVAEGP